MHISARNPPPGSPTARSTSHAPLDIDAGLDRIRALGAAERWLAVLVTQHDTRRDPNVALVNAGLVDHPVDRRPTVAFVARTGAKLTNLRARRRASLVFRSGWEWSAVHGPVELVGPDDPHPDLSEVGRTALLRTIYAAAGGVHPDLDAYDRAMQLERRCAVLLTPDRFSTNPPGAEHRETEERA